MTKFIVIYHAPMQAVATAQNLTAEERAKTMEPWFAWAKKCGDHLVDLGTPLMGGQRLSPDGTSRDSDFDVTGYSILQAENMAEAKALLKDHPHLVWDGRCSIEVHESMPLSGVQV